MLSIGPSYAKLKTNLLLAINRLKLMEKKKTELAQKARKEIADYIANDKYERARIRVEHIIREDYLVEAMELVEMYCDLLLARFGLIQQMKILDDGLVEAISSLIWAAPQLQTDIAELKTVADQLTIKCGKPYALAAKENTLINSVNEKLVHKLSIQAPPKILVEKYLIEIAKSHNISYEPDLEVLEGAEKAVDVLTDGLLIDFDGDSAKPHEAGFAVSGPSMDDVPQPGIEQPQPLPPRPFNYPPIFETLEALGVDNSSPPLPTSPPSDLYPTNDISSVEFNDRSSKSPYESADPEKIPLASNLLLPNASPFPSSKFLGDSLPELPSVPNTELSDLDDDESDDEAFLDDLIKRFEELKKRK